MTHYKGKRGGDVKSVAPEGFYTARQAMERLGLNKSTFYYYVKAGKITQHKPPLRKTGYYHKKEIDQMATEIALYFHTHVEEQTGTETRVARPEDAQGVYEVLASLGWQTASAEQRRSWYKINPFIDYVIVRKGEIAGYLTGIPYKPPALADIMAGRRRAWHMKPSDILPYRENGVYDLYVGIAIKNHEAYPWYAIRLIAGYRTFLEELAERGIHIRRMYAVSDRDAGQQLSTDLGFTRQESEPGDLFPRYMLDLETSASYFAQRYRELWRK